VDKTRKWLLAWNALAVACPAIAANNSSGVDSIVLYTGGHLLFALSVVVLSLSVRLAVRESRMTGMEAWWWLSIPYSAAFLLVITAFRLGTLVVHVLVLFLFAWFVTTFSAAIWTSAGWLAVYRARRSGKEQFTAFSKFTLGLGTVVTVLMLLALIVNMGRGN
jgi:hypothetical protein